MADHVTSTTANKQFLNSKELAELLGVSLRTVVNMRLRRQIPYIQMGHVIRYNRAAVEAVLDAFTVASVTNSGKRGIRVLSKE